MMRLYQYQYIQYLLWKVEWTVETDVKNIVPIGFMWRLQDKDGLQDRRGQGAIGQWWIGWSWNVGRVVSFESL